MKIKILYSHIHTPGDIDFKCRPSWFSYEKCFKNLLSTIDLQPLSDELQSGIEFHVIYDTTRGKIEDNWLYDYNPVPFIYTHEIKGGSMFGAAKEMYRIAKELSEDMEDDDLFYFVENDYLHVSGWVDKVTDLFESFKGLNYVSLYDHFDKYFAPDYEDLVSKIFATSSHHWRTTPSTCGSYICTKKLFLEDYDIHSGKEGDHNKWLYLAETKNRFLLTPIPGLSTHCMDGLLSPTIDWQKINN